MAQLLKHLVVAALIPAGGIYGSVDMARAQIRAPVQLAQSQDPLQNLMEGLLKSVPDGTENQQIPDNSAKLQELLKGLTKDSGAKGEQGMAEACLAPLLLPTLPGQNGKNATPAQQEKVRELERYFPTVTQLMARQDWDQMIEINQRALVLEKDIKEWPLASPRELLRGELWSHRGIAYRARLRGDRAENIETAIEAQKKALEVYQQGLKNATLDQACSFMVATIQVNLGGAYAQRIRGEAAENQELAIAAFEQALSTLSREATSQGWATAQNNLAAAYLYRIRGNRAGNIERGIAALEAVLQVWTREDFPAAWATVQSNLASAYLKRVRGSRADNIERAIEASTDSLTVRNREFPSGEKPIQNPLADLQKESQKGLDQLGMGDMGKSIAEALELALMAEAKGTRAMVALAPDGWAQSQNNLGEAYLKRINGDRAENVEHAVAAYEAALTLWTREAYPSGWAMAQTNLGDALSQRRRGKRTENLNRAVTALQAALEIRTSQAFPRDNLITARLLGQTLNAKADWQGALQAFETARTSFRLLFGQGLNEAESRDILQEAGPLFTEAAYSAAELGDGKRALATLEEGKARLLAVALKLEALRLSPAARQRLDVLRIQIREGDAAYDAAQGEEKTARITALGGLRAELLRLVDAAEAVTRQNPERDLVSFAGKVLPETGALVAPIVGEAGGKLILVVRNESDVRLSVIGLPQLTGARLGELLGARNEGGWLGAYSINYLDAAEQARRHEDWLSGIDKVGAELGTLLGRHLVEALSARGLAPGRGASITILPVGPLGLLPLGLTLDPKTRRYLMEDYTITFAPSLEALASAKARADAVGAKPSLAAIVNPTEDLPFTNLEGALVESRFSPDRRLAVSQKAATPQAVLAALKGREYWHFSSHGYFNWDEPRASGLLLTDRKPLTVGDLLDARDLGAPRLAVLSACETGLYDIATTPNEFTGLPAAFLQLGTGGVLATLWPVNDLSTALLMARFYDFHRADGLAPASALWKAQDWLRNAGSGELQNYVLAAVKDGRVTEGLSHSLETMIRAVPPRKGSADVRQERSKSGAPTAENVTRPAASPHPDAPFGHPYYWSGFTLTGQ